MKFFPMILLFVVSLSVLASGNEYSPISLQTVRNQAEQSFKALHSTYRHLEAYKTDGRITRLYGQPFANGANPVAAAQSFVGLHANVFQAAGSDLILQNYRADKNATQSVMYNTETGDYKFTLVYYSQVRDGLPVFNGELRLLVKNDQDYPVVLAVSTLRNLGDFSVSDKASVNFQNAYDAIEADDPDLKDFSETRAVIFAGVADTNVPPRLAVETIGENDFPEKWRFVVDAESGEILYRENLIIFTDMPGNISGLATEGSAAEMCANEDPTGLPYARVVVNGSQVVYADIHGDFIIPNVTGPQTITSYVWGQYFHTFNWLGSDAQIIQSFPLGTSADIMHNPDNTAQTRAEVNAYIHANVVRDFVLAFNPSYPVISTQTDFPVFVNRTDGYCPGNAWYNGSSINFCLAGASYPNTAFSTVVHHEYGHHLVATGGSGQGQYGEGMSDVVGMLIYDQSGVGFGFYGTCEEPLRDGDNSLTYPCSGEIHSCGRLISGCVWSTRNELIITEPVNYRQILASLALNAILLHTGSEITPQITIDWLTLDDDDGNLFNRTPHFDEICNGFSAHSMDCPSFAPVTVENEVLSDVAFGDGNGIPSAGETIQVLFDITNVSPETVQSVSVTLSCEDASLDITDAVSIFGTVGASSTVSNAGDPIVFDIPGDYAPRVDSFFFQIAWDNSGQIDYDTIIVIKNIGKSDVLIADHSFNPSLQQYYTPYFFTHRIPYDLINVGLVNPDSAYLADYGTVIWYTGDYRLNPLTASNIAAMKGYLNGGGNLFLTGQGIAKQLSTADADFLNNYLKSSYAKTQRTLILSAEPGAAMFVAGDTIAIAGGGASNQLNPDHILPSGDGVAELRYLNDSDFGAVSYLGADFKTVFFSFGFEALNNDDRFVVGSDAMNRILNFFSFAFPTAAPRITSLSLAGETTNHVVNHSPEIDWTFFDPDGGSQTMYEVQVDDDNKWEFIGLWNSTVLSGNDAQITYNGNELLDGESYFLRARAFNGVLWSSWKTIVFHMNSQPFPPDEMHPANMEGSAQAMPVLIHSKSVDRENDLITYDYEVYADSEMTTLITSVSGIPNVSQDSSYWTVDVALNDDEIYYWRVRPSDGYEAGEWSALAEFWVNSTNNAPQAFDLLVPDSGIALSAFDSIFTWNRAVDADPYDQIKYTLRYAPHPAFLDQIVVYNITDTTYKITQLLPGTLAYYWLVTAHDQFGASIDATSEFSFYLLNFGDANGDGFVDVGDAVFLINHIFKGGPMPDPYLSGDANCDGAVNVGDAVYIINYIFKGGTPPGVNCK